MIHVCNLTNPNTQRPAPNQFVIHDTETGETIFQSYETTVAKRDADDNVTLDCTALHYSRTTCRWLYIFLGMKRRDILNGIRNGTIKEADLNLA